MKTYFSENVDYYKDTNPKELLKEYGSPLYVYSEEIFRKSCREMVNLVDYDNFKVTYSIKANSSGRSLAHFSTQSNISGYLFNSSNFLKHF